MEQTRINLTVDADIPEMMIELAGGERKRGEWLSDLIRRMYLAGHMPNTADVMERLQELEQRIEKLERGRD